MDVLSPRLVWVGPAALALAALTAAPVPAGPLLTPAAVAGWTRYVALTERRIASELAARGPFLAQDFRPGAEANRRALLGGELVIEEMETSDERGQALEVPDAMVHHWRGAVLAPGARLDVLMAELSRGVPAGKPDDVLESRVLERGPDSLRLFMRLERRKFVTVVYNTEHLVRFTRHTPLRASSASTATRIVEVESPGTAAERELPAGEDRGFLWRLNAYWRYEQVPAGVLVECESVSLSRDVPFLLRYVAAPLIASTARESMERAIRTLRASSPAR